jgi:phage/plasmid-like protein (TIGR03299 family)
LSKETYAWLAANIRIGFTDQYGPAWWRRGAEAIGMAEGTHFPGPVPEDVVREILAVPLTEGPLFTEHLATTMEPVAPFWTTDRESNVCDVLAPVTTAERVTDPDRKVIYRADTRDILGIFKSGYKIHGYQEWTHDVVSKILDQGKGELQTKAVGLLAKGGQAFYQAILPEVIEVNGFGFQPFIGAATSADGKLASTFFTGDIPVVCDNTMSAAIRGAATKVKIRHSSESLGRIGEVRDALGMVYREADEFSKMITDLCEVKVSDEDWTKFLDQIAPMPAEGPKETKNGKPGLAWTKAEKRREELNRLWTQDPKAAPWTGTALGAFQAANTYNTWDRTVQSADGGRMERYYSQLATGRGASDDAEIMNTLSAVLGRDLVAA